MNQKDDVTTVSPAVASMQKKAALPLALLGGTKAMREAATKYLPQEPKESNPSYTNRLSRTTLHNAFSTTVRNLVGKLYSKPILLSEDTPHDIVTVLADVDGAVGTGRDFNRFLSHASQEGMTTGIVYVLCDAPALPVDREKNPVALSREAAKARKHHPQWLQYGVNDVVSWVLTVAGDLSRLVLRETVTVPEGEWGFVAVTQYRVLYPGRWEVYRRNAFKDAWLLEEQGTTTLDFIPFVPLYFSPQRAPLSVRSPLLEDLAELNVAHWQSASDQRNILHIARVPILFGTGFSDDDSSSTDIGASTLILQPPGATLGYIEHTGKAIDAGEKDLERIEAQMQHAAMEPFLQKTGTQTATAKAIDTAEAASALQNIAQGLKDSVEQLLVCTGAWYGIPPEKCGSVTINADFSMKTWDAAGIQELGKARALGDISRIAYLTELKRRDVMSDNYDIEADAELLDEPPTEV